MCREVEKIYANIKSAKNMNTSRFRKTEEKRREKIELRQKEREVLMEI